MATSQSTIDNLPEAERISVLDDLLNGVSGADIARRLGISRQAVSSYRQRVVKPALQTARKIRQVAPPQRLEQCKESVQSARSSNIDETAEAIALTRDIVRSSPFRDRLETTGNERRNKMKSDYRNFKHFNQIGANRSWDAARVEKLWVATLMLIAGGVCLLALSYGLGWIA
jgi:transcriptional regulator with XRE-family HTH domain